MSEEVSQRFKDWMIATGKSRNTASNYFTGVNIVSRHCGREVFDIEDTEELEQLYRLYGPKGVHADVGASNSGNVQNGLKQWLEYQRLRLQGQGEDSSIDPVEGRKNWDSFLARWPLETLHALALEQYYGQPNDDSFFSWMRDHTTGLGYFSEGPLSAGVRPVGAKSKAAASGTDTQTDGRYLWYSILGGSAEEAFERLKGELLTAIDAVQSGNMSLMAGLKDAPGALVWKTAFLYQDQTQPTVLPFYTVKRLKQVAGPHSSSNPLVLQQHLMSQRGDKELLVFAAELETQARNRQTIEKETESPTMTKPPAALNQILFGPPGTGKTYATINEALRILEPQLLDDPHVSRADLVRAFEGYVLKGQVVFCTFHQSFSYEDFVEGLRASSQEGQLHYEVEPGLFKRLCERAREGRTEEHDPFDQALVRLREHAAASDGRLSMQTIRGKPFSVEYSSGDTFLVFPASAETLKHGYTANLKLVRQLYQTGRKEGIYNPSYVEGMLRYLQDKCGLPSFEPHAAIPAKRDNFVLIIDEINRGNVSRIFGELITLIEESKRAGKSEALSVVLPYSKERFSVPSNLYLIGTMNTADRSLAGLDIALRRRFTFKEMPPQPDLLNDVNVEQDGITVNIGQLLRVMNQRIEVLLNRDHCLGHAYFMPLEKEPTLECLAAILKNKVLPQLQEYFFEDWQRIQWVLNDHRKALAERFLIQPETNLDILFGSDIQIGQQNPRWLVNDDAFESIEAFAGIIDHQSAPVSTAVKRQNDYNGWTIKQMENNSIEVWQAGERLVKAKPLLREIASALQLTLHYTSGLGLSTRRLGIRVLDKLEETPA